MCAFLRISIYIVQNNCLWQMPGIVSFLIHAGRLRVFQHKITLSAKPLNIDFSSVFRSDSIY